MTVIQSLVNNLLSDSNLLTPVELTPQAKLGIKLLSQMIESLPKGELLDFLHSGANYKLSTLATVVDGVINTSANYTLGEFSFGKFSATDSGVYQLKYGADSYIGSATNINARIANHVRSLSGLQGGVSAHYNLLDLTKGAWQSVNWAPIYLTPNFTDLALSSLSSNYSYSVGERDILLALSRFIPRVLEQSLISNILPTLNDITLVEFDAKVWDVSLLQKYTTSRDSIPISILDKSLAVLQEFPSITAAAHAVEYGTRSVSKWIFEGKAVYLPVLGASVYFAVTATGTRHNKVIPSRLIGSQSLVLPQGNLSDIASDSYWLFGLDKVTFHGPFANWKSVVKFCYPEMGHLRTTLLLPKFSPFIFALNRDTVVNTSKGSFYIACNPAKGPRIDPLNRFPKKLASRPFSFSG